MKDICYIIPPYGISGLSYVQYTESQEDEPINMEMSLSPKYSQNMTAEEMFMREADKVAKRRNSPTKRVNKDAPMF